MTPSEYVILAGVFVVEITEEWHTPRLVPLFANSRSEAQLSSTPEIFHVIKVSQQWLDGHHLDVNGIRSIKQESNP